MKRLLFLLGLVVAGCSGADEDLSKQADSVGTVPKLSKDEASQYANILPGKKEK